MKIYTSSKLKLAGVLGDINATHIRAKVMKFYLNIQLFPSFLVVFKYSLSFVLIHINII